MSCESSLLFDRSTSISIVMISSQCHTLLFHFQMGLIISLQCAVVITTASIQSHQKPAAEVLTLADECSSRIGQTVKIKYKPRFFTRTFTGKVIGLEGLNCKLQRSNGKTRIFKETHAIKSIAEVMTKERCALLTETFKDDSVNLEYIEPYFYSGTKSASGKLIGSTDKGCQLEDSGKLQKIIPWRSEFKGYPELLNRRRCSKWKEHFIHLTYSSSSSKSQRPVFKGEVQEATELGCQLLADEKSGERVTVTVPWDALIVKVYDQTVHDTCDPGFEVFVKKFGFDEYAKEGKVDANSADGCKVAGEVVAWDAIEDLTEACKAGEPDCN